MRTKKTPVKRQPRIKRTPKKKNPVNNLSKSAYRSPKKSPKSKTRGTPSSSSTHPVNNLSKSAYRSPRGSPKSKTRGTPSSSSTHASTLSSKSRKSNATTRTIESAAKKINVDSDAASESDEMEEDEEAAEAFDLDDIDWTDKASLAHACNFLVKLEDRRKLVGASHKQLTTAICDTQSLAMCKQLWQLAAVNIGKKDFKDTLKEVRGFGNKSKPIIVDKIMGIVNCYRKQNEHKIKRHDNDDVSDADSLHDGRKIDMDLVDDDNMSFELSDMDNKEKYTGETEDEVEDDVDEDDDAEDVEEDLDVEEEEEKEEEEEEDDGDEDGESIGKDAHEDVLFEFGHFPDNGFDHSADDTPVCSGEFLHNQNL